MTDDIQIDNMQVKKRKRIRAVEEMYINAYCAREIHDLIGDQFGVTYGTIRNDIVIVRKMWAKAKLKADPLQGGERHLAAMQNIRRRVMEGEPIKDGDGVEHIVGRDYKTAFAIDKEIAKLSGVTLATEERTIHLRIEEARDFVAKVMGVVMSLVTDAELQNAIIKGVEALDDE